MEQAIDEVIQPRIKENFRTESAAGEKWANLSDVTIRDRQRRGFTPIKKLHRTGRLEKAATTRRAIWTFKAREAYVDPRKLTARVPYAMYMEEGVDIRVPARPFLRITEGDAKQIEEIFGDYLMRREMAAAVGIRWALARRAGV